jgi:hypothetical protein
VTADTSELWAYAQHLEHALDHAEPALSRVVERGANNVKRAARQAVRGSARELYLKHYGRSISYDMDGPLAAEIGPDSSKPQGGMGRGVEFGSSDTPPIPHLLRSGEDEESRLAEHTLRAIMRALR